MGEEEGEEKGHAYEESASQLNREDEPAGKGNESEEGPTIGIDERVKLREEEALSVEGADGGEASKGGGDELVEGRAGDGVEAERVGDRTRDLLHDEEEEGEEKGNKEQQQRVDEERNRERREAEVKNLSDGRSLPGRRSCRCRRGSCRPPPRPSRSGSSLSLLAGSGRSSCERQPRAPPSTCEECGSC